MTEGVFLTGHLYQTFPPLYKIEVIKVTVSYLFLQKVNLTNVIYSGHVLKTQISPQYPGYCSCSTNVYEYYFLTGKYHSIALKILDLDFRLENVK